ncbi:CehA/McbA family metallohydrolase [Streptomyces sp. A1547]|uniref:CehA/McbA family metallohydrolase n=1 Tax=Streptomyces sp. A1547 TaxID=2563105 RepID=UPI00109E6123|nr:CehA/McbA family metallohydrolase [Streptomyces sp. A1547]THA36010.1 phosphoesterase [Streptomyces sp. A1547]
MALTRREVLATGATGAAAAATPHLSAPSPDTRILRGTIPPGAPDFVEIPLDVPHGVRELSVSYTYGKPPVPPGTPGNALDIGIFDQRGTALGGRGFRGWSGGARSEFFLRADDATPGYVPGPVDAGRWHILLGPYTVAPQGLPYEITAHFTFGDPGRTRRPVYPPQRARGRGRAWYRGDCHIHSVHSDGRRTPAEIAGLARAAGLDFINSSEHNTHSAHAAWADALSPELLIMTGEEITTRTGHVLAVGTEPGTFVDWRYRARENRFGRFARAIRGAGGLVVPAHPHATCIGCAWKFGFGEADAVEVWNGPWTPDDEVSLAAWDATLRGADGERWLPAVAGSDHHRDPDRIGGPQTVVLAEDLTRDAVLAGIRAGRSYAAESAQVTVGFEAVGARGEHAGIGERLRVAPDADVLIRLTVTGAPGCELRLITDQGPAVTAPDATTLEWRTTPARSAYVRAEVRHPAAAPPLPGAPAAFTNPVWLPVG